MEYAFFGVVYVMVSAVVSWKRYSRHDIEQSGACGVPVAESVLAPPGPIPNPVVTQYSAGEYCSGNAVGGEAAAGAPQVLELLDVMVSRGGAEAARWAHNPKVGGSNPPPATSRSDFDVRPFCVNPPFCIYR